MKKKYLVVIAILVVIFAFALVACDKTTYEKTYYVEISYPISLNLELNSENIDFTKYFVIKDDLGKEIPVTEDMLDLSGVDTSKTGTFGVTLTYEGKSCTAIFTVVAPRDTDKDDDSNKDDDKNDDKNDDKDDLSKVFALYDDYSKWNFVVKYTSFDGTDSYSETYKYLKDNIQYIYEDDDVIYTEYLEYTEDASYYYSDNGDGTYVKYDDSSWEFLYYYYALWTVELTTLNEIEFTEGDGYYSAVDANDAGNQIIGEVEDSVYTDVKLYVSDGKISKIVLKSDYTTEDGVKKYTDTFEFSGYGTVNFDLSGLEVTEEVGGDDQNPDAVDLSDLFEQYEDYSNWNFSVKLTYTVDGFYYDETYNYVGENFQYVYESVEGFTQIDYVEYAGENEVYYYYYEGDGIYSKFAYPSDEFWAYYQYTWEVDLGYLGYFDFVEGDGCYSASDVATVGNTIFGELENENYTDIKLYVSNGKITKLVVITDAEEDNTMTFEYSDYGNISFDLSSLKLSGDENPDNNDDPDTQTLTSVFTDKNLSVGAGQLTYTASRAANGMDDYADRGVQFTQKGGVAAVITSTQVVENVSSVTVTMASNATFTASVSVGGTAFLCNGKTSVTVSEGNADYTFESASPVSGKISVTLTPDVNKNSMYISKIVVNGTSNGGTTEPDDPVTPNKPNVMESQTYNPDTFDNDRLHAKIEKSEDSIGLPSYGDINVLVIPVQLKGDTITQKQLDNLNTALNGSSADTGWESVSSYYKKSSFGALNLTFDIRDVYKAKNNASYYAGREDGSADILKEALAYYDDAIDYSKYDTNGDDCIDAVYLIYSAPVAYQDSGYSENYENLYWAFVSWYGGEGYEEDTFDGLCPYYYLFAGFDFMEENSDEGFTVNASTYIHETGHVLGLDDYYDYDDRTGSNEHLGGADMMDYTVGDQNVYSKIMLGWVTPEIVTTTTTVTIESSTLTGDCILIPLNFDNSYFCEYLLIDLYTAEGLNEKHANLSDTCLYEGAEYGVRIYHVSSSIDKPYDTDYGSFTDCNNSDTSIALIKLLSADKKKKVLNGIEQAEEKDLWQTGDTLSSIYGSYKRNDGKVVNFDVTVTSVSADSATITITFDE